MDIYKNLEKLSSKFQDSDAEAAVALILYKYDENFEILFVKRVVNKNDPWSGQIALPGGRRNLEDKNLKVTVFREVFEEINVNLDKNCIFLGVLDIIKSIQKPEVSVLPFIFLLKKKKDFKIKLNEKELENYIWISHKNLVEHVDTVKFDFGEFPAFIIEDNVIWGLTFRILKNFIHKFES